MFGHDDEGVTSMEISEDDYPHKIIFKVCVKGLQKITGFRFELFEC